MQVSTISFILFLFATLMYFMFPSVGKLPTTLADVSSQSAIQAHTFANWPRLILYYVIVLVSQFILNSIYLTNKCVGSAGENVGYAFYITLGPWTMIFAVLLIVLNMVPDLKSAFSDVFGFFSISTEATDLFSKMLVGNEDTQHKINSMTDPSKRLELTNASDAIVKMMGNKSVIINQINQYNFESMWNMLTPLMKPEAKHSIDNKSKLLELVVKKETVGEMVWYLYSGILATSIVSYSLTSKRCAPSLESIKESEAKYKKKQKTSK